MGRSLCQEGCRGRQATRDQAGVSFVLLRGVPPSLGSPYSTFLGSLMPCHIINGPPIYFAARGICPAARVFSQNIWHDLIVCVMPMAKKGCRCFIFLIWVKKMEGNIYIYIYCFCGSGMAKYDSAIHTPESNSAHLSDADTYNRKTPRLIISIPFLWLASVEEFSHYNTSEHLRCNRREGMPRLAAQKGVGVRVGVAV